ncbi:MAG: tetraacyldisaccharide 4'-kinase [Acidobacteria bacterium]|nr:tetraacyldisaccharide 4'-kinase [Acidobacteriota bacterium]
MFDLLYAQAARMRRRAAERHPERQRRLSRPVISIGNLSVGGTGKTPIVAAIASWLVEQGERPSILSRGYGRANEMPGVVVVSDGAGVRARLAESGDEPLMLAHAVPGARFCVCADRYLAGTLAERVLGATVHVLDDGFQHLELARDLDVLVTRRGEITSGRVLPMGRLREPIDAAARAHFAVVMDATADEARDEAWLLGIGESCGATRRIGAPIALTNSGTVASELSPDARVFLVAGIANPERFAGDVRGAGWNVVGECWFRDHHRFTAADIARVRDAASRADASLVFTTEKDAVRLEPLGALPFAIYRVPLQVAFDPPRVLFDRLRATMAATAKLRADSPGKSAVPTPFSPDRNAVPAETDGVERATPASRLPPAASRGDRW